MEHDVQGYNTQRLQGLRSTGQLHTILRQASVFVILDLPALLPGSCAVAQRLVQHHIQGHDTQRLQSLHSNTHSNAVLDWIHWIGLLVLLPGSRALAQ